MKQSWTVDELCPIDARYVFVGRFESNGDWEIRIAQCLRGEWVLLTQPDFEWYRWVEVETMSGFLQQCALSLKL